MLDSSRTRKTTCRRWVSLAALTTIVLSLCPAQTKDKPLLPAGVFLASVEEGARIFTPVRILPFTHPESQGHQFPNALQLFGNELDAIIWLGRQTGMDLRATLLRYPMEPSSEWPYHEFSQLPDTAQLRTIPCVRRPRADAPLPGLRGVLFVNQQPVSFIVDTRTLSLARRGMKRPTSMGLDISRADFLAALGKAVVHLQGAGTAAVIFEP